MTDRQDTRPIAGTPSPQEDLVILEDVTVGLQLAPRSVYNNNFWKYSPLADDIIANTGLDETPGLTYLGPAGNFVMGFNDFDIREGTTETDGGDTYNIDIYVNGGLVVESDEGVQTLAAGGADLEFNAADTIVSLSTGDVVRFVLHGTEANEDDVDLDTVLVGQGAFSIRPVVGQSVVSGGVATGALYFSSASATTIATAGTPVKAAGTTAAIAGMSASTDSVDVTVATTNRLTYTGNARKRMLLNANVDLSHADVEGATQRCGVQIYLNGSAITGAENRADVEANGRNNLSVSAVIEMGLDDYVEIWVSNEESTANVTVQTGSFTIQSL